MDLHFEPRPLSKLASWPIVPGHLLSRPTWPVLRNPVPVYGNFTYLRKLHGREIRLLRILEGRAHESLQCRLFYQSLDEDFEYVALSYAWGFVNVTQPIECDGQEILVAESVYSALRSLRDLGMCGPESQPLWVDALCINQRDDVEKTEQVKMMRDIYAQAVHVTAWLGSETEADQRGIALLEQIHQIIIEYDPENEESRNRLEQLTNLTYTRLQTLGLPDETSLEWDNLQRILEKPWFSRVWIIQEFMLAKAFVFVIGTRAINPDVILFSAGALFSTPFFRGYVMAARSPQPHIGNAAKLMSWKYSREEGEEWDLLRCLSFSSNFGASDGRDKVFAPAALSSTGVSELIDYTQDVGPILIRAAMTILKTIKNPLDILSYSQCLERTEQTPSWVPDWSGTTLVMVPIASTEKFQQQEIEPADEVCRVDIEGGHVRMSVCIYSKLNLFVQALIASAALFDHIESLAESEFSSTDTLSSVMREITVAPSTSSDFAFAMSRYQQGLAAVFKTLFQAKEMVDSLLSYPTGQAVCEIFWRSLIHDSDHLAPVELKVSLDVAADHLRRVAAGEDLGEQLLTISRLTSEFERTSAEVNAIAFKGATLVALVVILIAAASSITTMSFPSIGKFAGFAGLYILAVSVLTYAIHFMLGFRLGFRTGLIKSSWKNRIREADQSTALDNEASCNIGRRMCITRNGYVLWAPQNAVRGDEVHFFKGNNIPFVLRKQSNLGTFELVGDCYVHGMMGRGPPEWLAGTEKQVTIM